MADEVKAAAVADEVKASEEPTRTPDAPTEASVEEKDTPSAHGGEAAAPEDAAEDKTTSSPQRETAANGTDSAEDGADAAPAVADANVATPAPKNSGRRKSVSTDKKKTPAKTPKGKKPVELRLDAKPGDMFLVSMKGYPAWPVIICDEDMLPESLLSKRPVSARRIDGTYREDFADDGKSVKDRRYPIMFLGTNEFAWEVNTALQTLDIEALKQEVADGTSAKKKKKALWEAYEVAAEEHDLQWFKDLLAEHEKATQLDVEAQIEAAAAAEAKKAEAKEKKPRRKSTAPVVDDDVEMEDADTASAKKSKPTKKRKKGDETDSEEKPAKTPKTTKLKLNNKATPGTTPGAKAKRGAKAKAEKAESVEETKVEEPQMTEEERAEKLQKSVLYLRHRLQKGFISRDQPPKEDEMEQMTEYFTQLEELTNLPAQVIKTTKVHKVLKAIVKLTSIPKEEEYHFKDRATALLQNWSAALAATDDAAPAPATNGVKNGDEAGEAKNSEDEKKEDVASVTDKVEKTTLQPEGEKEETAQEEDAAMPDVDEAADADTKDTPKDDAKENAADDAKKGASEPAEASAVETKTEDGETIAS